MSCSNNCNQGRSCTCAYPQRVHHCTTARGAFATPWQCRSGAKCRITPLVQHNSDGSAQSGKTMRRAVAGNLTRWLKFASWLAVVAFAIGFFSNFLGV